MIRDKAEADRIRAAMGHFPSNESSPDQEQEKTAAKKAELEKMLDVALDGHACDLSRLLAVIAPERLPHETLLECLQRLVQERQTIRGILQKRNV